MSVVHGSKVLRRAQFEFLTEICRDRNPQALRDRLRQLPEKEMIGLKQALRRLINDSGDWLDTERVHYYIDEGEGRYSKRYAPL